MLGYVIVQLQYIEITYLFIYIIITTISLRQRIIYAL